MDDESERCKCTPHVLDKADRLSFELCCNYPCFENLWRASTRSKTSSICISFSINDIFWGTGCYPKSESPTYLDWASREESLLRASSFKRYEGEVSKLSPTLSTLAVKKLFWWTCEGAVSGDKVAILIKY